MLVARLVLVVIELVADTDVAPGSWLLPAACCLAQIVVVENIRPILFCIVVMGGVLYYHSGWAGLLG